MNDNKPSMDQQNIVLPIQEISFHQKERKRNKVLKYAPIMDSSYKCR